MICRIKKENNLPYFALTGEILSCCFDVMKELGSGFLERVYSAPQAHRRVHRELKLCA
jgi:hypothetical protein